MSFKILTDSTSDLNLDWASEHQVDMMGLTVEVDGQVYETVGPDRLVAEDLLEKMRKGSQPKTSQVNVGTFEEYFREQVEAGEAVLYIAISSVLSGTYQSAVMARDLILEDYPKAQIRIVDTLAVSGGEGYLVRTAVEARDAGVSLDEVAELVLDKAPRLRSYFLVDDLNHLMRGGRLSRTSALVGSLVNIKPILWIDAAGRILPLSKVRGRKKGVAEILKYATEDLADQTAVVAYANDRKGAEQMRDLLLEEGTIQQVVVEPLGPVISAHVGPDTLALFVVGQQER
ncbi:DegV family protein [Streptococcus sp. DD13]|uniref:DegV family protein n=1 Tax=Streptococcus sp. DD13 TaxID=1777881 RepID=UPI0008302B70|nr:DegV family protein [Streptococcus sp. DD13]